MKRLVLAGGGHAHLLVLERLAFVRARKTEVVLVTPSQWQHYSGMLPGWMEGLYRAEECRIDLLPLVARAKASVKWQRLTGLDADQKTVRLADGSALDYDVLSLDTGGERDVAWATGLSAPVLAPKPIETFQDEWSAAVAQAKARGRLRLAVVGGGAAGAELALAARHALSSASLSDSISLVTGRDGLMPGFNVGAREKVMRALARSRIDVIESSAQSRGADLTLMDGRILDADLVIASTGTRAPSWLAGSRLKRDGKSFVAVDAFQRSVSHGDVFAAGDVAARIDGSVGRSGVDAVRVGPVLAHNLVAAASGAGLRAHRPRRNSLYIIATGERSAVASWGPLSARGSWVWRWKNAIDRRFIARFRSPEF